MLYALVIISIFGEPCSAAFEYAITGARPAAMGGAFVALADEPDAPFLNPAGLTCIEGNVIGASYSRPYGLSNVSLGLLGYVHPTGTGGWGLGVRSFGNSVYRENTFGLSRGYTFGKGLHLGTTMNVFHLSIQRFGSVAAFGLDIGALIRLSRPLWTGLCIGNINMPGLGESGERLPRSFHFGLRSHPEDELIVTAELRKDGDHPIQFRLGQEYRIAPLLAIRLGLSTRPTNLTGGAGFRLDRYRFDYAFTSHSVLGGTHQVSMTIQFGGSSIKPDFPQDEE